MLKSPSRYPVPALLAVDNGVTAKRPAIVVRQLLVRYLDSLQAHHVGRAAPQPVRDEVHAGPHAVTRVLGRPRPASPRGRPRGAGHRLVWDTHLAHAVERWRLTSGPKVGVWLETVGELEALASLAGYRFERPDDVWPELVDGAPHFEAEALAHPLLTAEAVANDVRLGTQPQVLILSGSNMAGKSTLLRTIGVNAVLAQAGAPVRARRLRMSPLAVGASIRIIDSLQDGSSRFHAEILRLRACLARTRGEEPGGDGAPDDATPVLFLIDECLHGTNSHDRRIGADVVVGSLVTEGAIGLVTTHDLTLTAIADVLGRAPGTSTSRIT